MFLFMKNICGVMTSKRKSSLKILCFAVVFIFALHWLIRFEQIREHGDFGDLPIVIDPNFVPLGISELEDFPVIGTPKIPLIIHQTWKDTHIPSKFEKWIKSWTTNHPDWQYILWTDESARELIAEKYPEYLSIFDGYSENIRRADALRYFVLYEFGGVYADMDVESLKSLIPMTYKYSCFIGQEPYEHSIMDTNFEHLVINALIGCNKGHPFMKMVIDYLPFFSHMWNVLDSTGPHFMTFVFLQYTNLNQFPPTHENGTYLAPAEYFFPVIDPLKHFSMRSQCQRFNTLSDLQKRACMNLKVKSTKRSDMFAFTTHHWIHSYLTFHVSLKGPVDVQKIVRRVQIYSTKDGLHEIDRLNEE